MTDDVRISDAVSAWIRFEVARDADWNDSVQLSEAEAGASGTLLDESNAPILDETGAALLDEGGPAAAIPYDLTGARQTLIVRPSFEFSTTIATLDTLTGELFATGADNSTANIFVPRSRVATWPPGTWVFVWYLRKPGESRELARGELIVH